MRNQRAPVMVCYDGSADSDRALEWAITAATQRLCPLRLVAVHEAYPAEGMDERVEDAHRRVVKQLSAVGDRPGGLPVEVMRPREDPATHALLRLAADAQLVVVGARGHGVLAGLLIGSVSQHLARHADCSVVVVREQHDAKADRIVIGYDDSDGSRRAVDFGFEQAHLSGAPVTVIHGWRYSTAGTAGMFLPMSPTIAEEIDSERADLQAAMAGWSERYPDVLLTVEAVPLHPTRVLADASESASLVVVGSRGRGAFTGLLLGSVSQGLLHHAGCTVAIAR